METLAHFAAAAPRLELGVGVLPLDRHQPAQISAEIDRLGLDPAKLWIGVGSGPLRPQIDVVRRSVAELRELLPEETRNSTGALSSLERRAGAPVDFRAQQGRRRPGAAAGCDRRRSDVLMTVLCRH